MRRIPELDGFRALAVTMVMADHMIDGWPLPPAATSWMPGPVRSVVTHGWLGVDLFFILSGFLITGILLDESKHHYFRSFYARRATRILPLAVVVIAVCAIAYGQPYGRFFVLALLFCANLHGLIGAPVPHGASPLWSLSVEEHFYLGWPVLVLLLKRWMLAVVAITIVLLSPFLRAWAVSKGMHADGAVYELSWFRFDGLGLGALLAIWVRSPYFTPKCVWLSVAGWGAVIAAITVVLIPYGALGVHTPASSALRSPQGHAIFIAAVALSLLYPGSRLWAPLRSPLAKRIATLSYCLYLVHLPLGDLYYWTLHRLSVSDSMLGGPGMLLVRTVIVLTASFALAQLSQRYLEGPFMHLRRLNSTETRSPAGPGMAPVA